MSFVSMAGQPVKCITQTECGCLQHDVGSQRIYHKWKIKDYYLTLRLSEIAQPVLLTCGDGDKAGVKTVKDFQELFLMHEWL
jgi:hypothetical protein